MINRKIFCKSGPRSRQHASRRMPPPSHAHMHGQTDGSKTLWFRRPIRQGDWGIKALIQTWEYNPLASSLLQHKQQAPALHPFSSSPTSTLLQSKQICVQLPTLPKHEHCSDLLLTTALLWIWIAHACLLQTRRAAIDQYRLPDGLTAANPPHAMAAATRWDRRREGHCIITQ